VTKYFSKCNLISDAITLSHSNMDLIVKKKKKKQVTSLCEIRQKCKGLLSSLFWEIKKHL